MKGILETRPWGLELGSSDLRKTSILLSGTDNLTRRMAAISLIQSMLEKGYKPGNQIDCTDNRKTRWQNTYICLESKSDNPLSTEPSFLQQARRWVLETNLDKVTNTTKYHHWPQAQSSATRMIQISSAFILPNRHDKRWTHRNQTSCPIFAISLSRILFISCRYNRKWDKILLNWGKEIKMFRVSI